MEKPITICTVESLTANGIFLHDAKLRQMNVNYDERKIQIPIKLDKLHAILSFEDVIYADISFYEPWGAGVYINEFYIKEKLDILERLTDCKMVIGYKKFVILLNSGDTINIVAGTAILKKHEK